MFLIYVSAFLGFILFLALISVHFILDSDRKKILYRFFVVTDLAIIFIMFGGFILRANFPDIVINYFGSFASVFFMTQLICGGLVIFALIVRAIYRKFHKPTNYNPERRRALKWGLFYPLLALATSLYGNRIERLSEVENFFDIPIKNLPPELENFKIAQISDVHLGAYFSLERLENLLQKISDAKPDLLAITGDIFDDNKINSKAIQLVNSFCDKFKFGIFYIHGNHEHHRGIASIEAELHKTKIHWLVNSSENVTSKRFILGVDYPPTAPIMSSGGRGDLDEKFYQQKRDFVEQALKNVPYDAVCILLAHHPEFIDDGAEKNIPLTLTGHTHGGQIGIFGLSLVPVFKYTRGMVRNENSFGYVHVGNGSWFPFRLGCSPEIAYFTLRKN